METPNNDFTLKHIDIIQSIIGRQAQNSFLIRGWSITLFSIVFAFVGTVGLNPTLLFFAVIPILCFWYLDVYYLRQERLYRQLYLAVVNDINQKNNSIPTFDLSTERFNNQVPSMIQLVFSKTALPIPLTGIFLCIAINLILIP